jgi:hypothetical protein
MDEKIKKAKEKLHKVYEEGEKYEMKLLKELESELEKEKISERKESDEIKKAEDRLKKIYEDGEKFELEMLKEMRQNLKKNQQKQTEDKLKKIYEDGEKTEGMLIKQLKEKTLKEKNEYTSLTIEQQKEAIEMGVRLADEMELDMLKLKYQQNLKENGGIRNKKIEELIENLKKKKIRKGY